MPIPAIIHHLLWWIVMINDKYIYMNTLRKRNCCYNNTFSTLKCNEIVKDFFSVWDKHFFGALVHVSHLEHTSNNGFFCPCSPYQVFKLFIYSLFDSWMQWVYVGHRHIFRFVSISVFVLFDLLFNTYLVVKVKLPKFRDHKHFSCPVL